MKYYAVTEDPNELLHYGVKGMKWGQHIFGDKPKSPGFSKALGKLRASYKKSKEQRAITREQKRQDKYNKAVQKAQMRIQITENMRNLDNLTSYQKSADRQYRQDRKMAKVANRMERKAAKDEYRYAKNESKMDKYLQQARQGKLKYGKLSDDQVREITDRLGMERSARSLGSAEKTWRQQKKEAFRKGKLLGIERGTAASMEELARAGTIYGIQNWRNRKKLKAVAKQEGQEERIKNRERNKKTRKDIAQEVKNEGFEARVREGQGIIKRNMPFTKTAKAQAKYLERAEEREHEKKRIQAVQDRIKNETDLANNTSYQKMLSDQRERKRIQDVQDRLASERDESFEKRAIEAGYASGEDAVEAYGKNLGEIKYNAERRYGKNSTQYKAADRLFNEFSEADYEGRKNIVNNASIASEKAERNSALSKFEEFYRLNETNAEIDAFNTRAENIYQQRLAAYNKNGGTKPRKPTVENGMLKVRKTTPSFSAREIELLKSIGLNPYGGGGGKGNKGGKK